MAAIVRRPGAARKKHLIRLTAAGLILVALTCGCGTTPGPHGEYVSRIGRQWHPVVATGKQASLASGSDTANCQVKAYGWRMLSQHRVKSARDPWFQRGRAQQEWGWKLLVHNAGNEPRIVNITVDLMTDEGQRVQRSRLAYMQPISVMPGGPAPEAPIPKNVVEPGETRLFTMTSSYWIDEHEGEGRPDRVQWSILCLDMNPDSLGVSLKMASGESQPSN